MQRSVQVSLAAVWLVATSTALAWQTSVLIRAKVWGHEFSEVDVSSSGCVVTTKLKYSGPEQAYKSRLKGMNHYRFKARSRFASGKVAVSQVFSSTQPGRRSQSFSVDTKAQGCWAKQVQALSGLDVEGCRGEACEVEPFK